MEQDYISRIRRKQAEIEVIDECKQAQRWYYFCAHKWIFRKKTCRNLDKKRRLLIWKLSGYVFPCLPCCPCTDGKAGLKALHSVLMQELYSSAVLTSLPAISEEVLGLDEDTLSQLMNPVNHQIARKLLEQRKIYLWGQVSDASARHVVERLLYLDAESSKKDIYLYINSPGGVITAGMAIYDTMQMIKSQVSTVCMGLAASMGALLLCGGHKGKRYLFPHSRVMIHQPLISGQIIAPAIDIKIQAEEIRKIREELNKIIAKASNRPMEQVEIDTDRDYYLNAKEALEYGIADKIIDRL